ncbi:MAG: TraM recognition domain-containing protein [Actinobacteria bacterium]|nr:TraM recognition domain-containing protein [Actinomycetota bacterium]MCL5408692.1 TraM recognition domain-containing protein [Candidatus Omnitrophota bacterium]
MPLIKDDIKNKRSLIIIDAKGDKNIIKQINKSVRDFGREKDFQPFILDEVERSCTYNPLQKGNSTQLKDKIISAMDWPTNLFSTDSSHYKNKCANALQILFNEHNEKKDKEPLTLSQVYDILQNSDINQYPKLAKFLKNNLKDISSLTTELSLLINSEFGSLFESPKGEIDFMDAYKNNKIIYFSLNTQSYSKAATKLGKIITEELKILNGEIINSDFKDRHPMGIFIDEFQLFGTESFMDILATGRTSGFMILLSITCIEDLDKIGGKAYRAQIIQNTNIKIAMKMNNMESAKALSDVLGVYKTIERTHQTIVDRIFSRLHTITEKVVDKKIIPTQVFLELKIFEAILIHGKNSDKIICDPIFPNVKNEPLPPIRHRKNPDKDQSSSNKPQPPKSVF